MGDVTLALIEYLKGYPALLGVPVYAPKLPTSQRKLQPSGCLVIAPNGGFGQLQAIGLYHQRIDLVAYGPTGEAARVLHTTGMQAMNAIDDSFHWGVMLCDANLENGAVSDEDSGPPTWPFVFSTWGLMTIFD